jgi:hypothetical protein
VTGQSKRGQTKKKEGKKEIYEGVGEVEIPHF